MGEIDFLIKVRDAACMIKDACEERIEELAPKNVKSDLVPDLDGVIWNAATGPRGSYEKTEDVDNPAYKRLLNAIKEHQGKMVIDNHFVWLFDDNKTIGKKPKQ